MAMMEMMMMLILMSGGGGNELLNYLDTNAYWQAKGGMPAAEALIGELSGTGAKDISKLLKDFGAEDFATRDAAYKKILAMGPAVIPQLEKVKNSSDPEVKLRVARLLKELSGGSKAGAVRRLMAIRTLGELKKEEALKPLEGLLTSKEPFVAEYAKAAIAAIKGEKPVRPAPDAEKLWSDIWLLPKKCGIVAKLGMEDSGIISFDKALKALKDMGPMAPPNLDKKMLVKQVTQAVLMVAERIGNLRIDAITFGLADEVDNNSGFAVFVARGLYDREAVKAAFTALGATPSKIGDTEFLSMDRHAYFMLPSNERLIFVAGPNADAMPLKDLAAAVKAKKGELDQNERMAALLKGKDPTPPLLAVAYMSKVYREAPLLEPLDTIALTSKKTTDGIMLTLTAKGADAEKVKAAQAMFEAGLAEAKGELQKMIAQMPPMKPVVALLESVAVKGEGGTITVTATLKGSSKDLGTLLIMSTMMPMHMMKASMKHDIDMIEDDDDVETMIIEEPKRVR